MFHPKIKAFSFLLLPLLLLVNLSTGIQAQSKIEFVKIKDVKINKFNLNKIEISGRLVLFNHLRLGAKIKSIQVDVYVEGSHVGTIYDSYVKVLRKRQATDIPLQLDGKVKANLSKLFTNGGLLIRGQTVKIEYKGKIHVKALGMVNKRLYFEDDLFLKLSDLM
ncbi:MAG: hypothetical protein R2730_05870 [Chitinophagales bacterium]